MAQIFLNISILQDGKNEFDFSWTPKQLELEYNNVEFPEPVECTMLCIRRGLEVTCSAKVRTIVRPECSRCLDKYEVCLDGDFIFLVRLAAGSPVSVDLWNEDVVRVDPHAGKVNIAPRIRDEIILAIPAHPLCIEDCKGLCPICGINLNKENCEHSKEDKKKSIDPRWAKLQELLNEKKNK